jgi:titin
VVQGVEYFYNVAAINIRGPSPLSPVAAATPMDRPDPPSDLEVVSGDGYALLTWGPPISDGGSPLLAYEIWRSGSDGPGPTFSLDPRETRFNDTGLTNGVTYNYHMTSRNMAGRSGPTKELSIVAAGLPGPPRDLRARSGNGYVLLTWLPPLDDGGFEITGIEIFRSRDGSDPSEIGEVHGTSSAFNDTEAENGHRYTYWIAAVTSIGASSLEGPAEGAPIGPPDPPSDVRAIPGDHFVLIYWSPPSNDGGASVDRYSVLRGMTPRSMRAIASVGNGTFVYNDTSVTNGIAYFYSVRAFNPFYGSDTPAGLAAEPLGLPTPPTDIAAELVPGLARVTWNPPSDDGGSPVELYRIVRTSDADDGAGSFELGPGILNFLDANVTRPGTVYYSLACRNRVGWSENGETVSITISGVPGKVGSVKALLSEGVVTITWDPPVGPSSDCSYKVYRTAEGSDPLLIGTTHGPQTSFRDTSPSPGRSSYFVRAVNERGMGDPSDRAEVEVPSAGTERDDGWAMTAISVVLLALSCCLLIAWLVRRRK